VHHCKELFATLTIDLHHVDYNLRTWFHVYNVATKY